MQTITPFLWFNDQAEEAMHFYTSIFKDSKVGKVIRYDDEVVPGPKGKVVSVTFQLNGQDFMALNGGPAFKFNEAVSFYINVETQAEVDELWEKLSDGGEPGQCGWLKDKYGVSWQVVPSILSELMNDPDPEKSKRVTQTMLQMNKLDIETLQRAYDQA